jgi:hypothetical protein
MKWFFLVLLVLIAGSFQGIDGQSNRPDADGPDA